MYMDSLWVPDCFAQSASILVRQRTSRTASDPLRFGSVTTSTNFKIIVNAD